MMRVHFQTRPSLHAGKEVVDKCLHYQVNLHYEFCTVHAHELVTNRDVKTAC